jgi:dTDP-4-dehydrorhamnose reductase
MRVLITGANGQLGIALQKSLRAHEVTALGHASLDITEPVAVQGAVSEAKPEVVIHCAAWTDTNGCERDPERAMLVNGEGARNVAQAAREAAAMVYVSSNEVFDGEKGSAYDEDDAPNPINAYGRSKLAGEVAVRETLDKHYIVRTSWVYGPGRVSFPEKILNAAASSVEKGPSPDEKPLHVVTDEIASPTWTNDLAEAITLLMQTNEYGVYHLAGEGECSRLEWAQEILRLATVNVPIEATTQDAMKLPVRKPVRSTLANRRGAKLGVTLRPWRDALADHMALVAEAKAGASA